MSFVEEIVYLVQNISFQSCSRFLWWPAAVTQWKMLQIKFDAFIDRVMPWQREYHPVLTQSLI